MLYVSTLGTNIHKQELFVMAIRTPTGKPFPGNYTIIPSSKKWVFHSKFYLAFLSLYGEHVCSMNQLVLTDEEDAEYPVFETMIATHDAFCSSKVILCTFHAVWQPFKRDIYNLLLSKKSPKGKVIELADVGKLWGENLFLIYRILSLTTTNIKLLSSCDSIISKLSLCNLSASGVCISYKGTVR
jgi:hypothetical protein